MNLKSAKIISFSIFSIFFGLGQISEALIYTNSIEVHNETSELISKEGGGKKGGGKKGGAKKGGAKKGGAKKGGSKKGESNKKGDKKTQNKFNKVHSNNESMREEAKERYKLWKQNKKAKK